MHLYGVVCLSFTVITTPNILLHNFTQNKDAPQIGLSAEMTTADGRFQQLQLANASSLSYKYYLVDLYVSSWII